MEPEHREVLAKQVLRTMESLNNIIHAGGGTPITCDALESMSLFEFICRVVAPNEIRFVLPPRGAEDEEEYKGISEDEEEYEGISKETRPLGH